MIVWTCRVPASLAPVFSGAQRDALHSGKEVEAALRRYVAEQGLAAGPAAAELKLDRLLIEVKAAACGSGGRIAALDSARRGRPGVVWRPARHGMPHQVDPYTV